MASLLLRVHDKVNEDFYLNTQCTKRGDVIVVQADDWAWGREELTAPFWRILIHRRFPVPEAEALLAAELDIDPTHPSRTLQARWFKLDLDRAALPPRLDAYLADDTRTVPALDITRLLALARMRAWKVQKPPIDDPAVIG